MAPIGLLGTVNPALNISLTRLVAESYKHICFPVGL